MKTGSEKMNICGTIAIAMAVIGFAFCIYAILDTVKATGTGYYMYLNSGVFTRGGWDIICTLVIAVAVLCITIAAAVILHGSVYDMALFFLANGALTKYVRPDRILAPFTGGEALERSGVYVKYLDYAPAWILTIVFLLIISSAFDDMTEKTLKKHILKCVCASALMLALGYLINSAFELFLFAAGVSILLPVLKVSKTASKKVMVIPGGVFFICMIWKLYMATALYHM